MNKQQNQSTTATEKPWWQDGVRFECQGSGKCCTSHGEYGFVFVSPADRKRFAKHLKISTRSFSKKYCDTLNGVYHLKEDPKNPDCMFLIGKRCSVYDARPAQCRTWPFWPEVMNAKTWKKEVVTFCPGLGKGPKISAASIKKNLAEQSEAEDAMLKEAKQKRKP